MNFADRIRRFSADNAELRGFISDPRIGSEVFTAVIMKIAVVSVTVLCGLMKVK
jgi:hypothetical protein